MNNALHFTGYDFVIIGLLLIFVLRGLWVGFLRQIAVLTALVVGYIVAGQYHDKLFPFLREVTDNPQAVFWTSYVIIFALTYVVTMFIGKGLAKVVEMTVAGWFDKLLGGVLGFTKGVILVVLLNMVLAGILAPENTMIKSCQLCPYVKQASDAVRSLIKDEKIRESFVPKEPAISPTEVIKEFTEEVIESSENFVRPFVPEELPEEQPAAVE